MRLCSFLLRHEVQYTIPVLHLKLSIAVNKEKQVLLEQVSGTVEQDKMKLNNLKFGVKFNLKFDL
jgi:hypothetical protein